MRKDVILDRLKLKVREYYSARDTYAAMEGLSMEHQSELDRMDLQRVFGEVCNILYMEGVSV